MPTIVDRSKIFPKNAAQIWAGKKKLPFVRTFSPRLNAILGGGLRCTGTYILTGGPGAGKSTTSLHIADAAINDGWPVIYVSAELSAQLVVARYASTKLGMSWLETIDTEDPVKIQQIQEFAESLGNRFWVLDPAQATDYDKWIPQIRDNLTPGWQAYMKSIGKPVPEEQQVPTLVVIDYIQDLAQPRISRGKDQRTAVGELSKELRTFADTHDVPLWIVSSTSRVHYAGNEDQRDSTLIGSAKDAGEVEYDSNAVIHVRQKNSGNATAIEMVVAKNRFGKPMQSIIFDVNPDTGYMKETNLSAKNFAFEIQMMQIINLITDVPYKFNTPGSVAKELKLKTAEVKPIIDQLLVGAKGTKLFNNYDGKEGYVIFLQQQQS